MAINFDAINQAAEMVRNTGATMGALAQAFEAVSTLFNRTKGGTDPDLEVALADLKMQVANAQMANAMLTGELTTLQTELGKLKHFQTDLERYYLWETPTGRMVYRLKDDECEAEPLHYLCPHCALQSQKSILQGDQHGKRCPACKTAFAFEPYPRGRSNLISKF